MTQPNHHDINLLANIMARLRDPESGCPWDVEQNFATIAPYTVEEAYEVADAIARGDRPDLRDELGDLLLQVVFHARMAQEQKAFQFKDVVDAICDKLIRRHPHVFGDTVYADEQAQKQAWETLKQAERDTQATPAAPASFFAGIPAAMPALRRSQKIQQRAARVGFDWDHWQHVIPKIHEELNEVIDAVAQQESAARIEEEVGDVLMGATNMARLLGVNAENALRLSNQKFERRFLRIEALLAAEGISLEQASLEQMENAWSIAKQEEKAMNGS